MSNEYRLSISLTISLLLAISIAFLCSKNYRVTASEPRLPQPITLTASDFDEDGVVDLAIGFNPTAEGQAEGAISLRRGNLASLHPHAAEVRPSGLNDSGPFLPTAQTFNLPLRPDFIEGGDFDADGHLDLVIAQRDQSRLVWLRGDGRGHFGNAQIIELSGTVTAVKAGEVNRADGLAELAVGVRAPNGAATLLIYEGPAGALSSEPESFALSAAATAFVFGSLDGDEMPDLALAAGVHLLVLHGRDRKLSLEPAQRAAVTAAQLDEHLLQADIMALAVGDFSSTQRQELALLLVDGTIQFLADPSFTESTAPIVIYHAFPDATAATLFLSARVSAAPNDQLIIGSPTQQAFLIVNPAADSKVATVRLRPALPATELIERFPGLSLLKLEAPPVAALPLRLNSDALSDLVILAGRANAELLQFVLTAPATVFTVTNTNGDGAGSLAQALRNANTNPGLDQINFNLPGNPPFTLSGLLPVITDPVVLDGTTQPGYAGTPLIALSGCGAQAPGSPANLVITAGNSTVRGLSIRNCNFRGSFSQQGYGIFLGERGNNLIEANYIGLNRSGDCALNQGNCPTGNFTGLRIENSANNLIGGTTTAARNLISGNIIGISLLQSSDTRVQGNYIGPDLSGTKLIASDFGLMVEGGNNNVVGGVAAGARNLFSGIRIVALGLSSCSGCLAQGNYFGTDPTGTKLNANINNGDLGAGGAPGILIGGTTPAARNVLTGTLGISDAVLVQGNYLGVNATGNESFGEFYGGQGGIQVSGSNNVIGGVIPGARNVIWGGITLKFEPASNNQVLGNYIGVNAAGTAALKRNGYPLTWDGIQIARGSNNQIGGASPGAGNVISAATNNGISINGRDNKVQGNRIGTLADGVSPAGNHQAGVAVLDGGSYPGDNASSGSNLIGGTENGAGNIIAFNGMWGAAGGTIRGNKIFANVGLGIDLGAAGLTPNVPNNDTQATGWQNAPVITLALANAVSANMLTLQGSLNSYSNKTFALDFYANPECDYSGFGEGVTYLGSTTVTTGADNNAAFNVTLPVNVPVGQFITATATRADSNTSEFSACVAVTSGCLGLYPKSEGLARGRLLIPHGGGTASLGVSTLGSCNWTATSSVNWITITSGTSGNGAGTINLTALPNPTAASRIGTITVGNQRTTVAQAGQVVAVNAASYSTEAIWYRSIAAIFGTQLTQTTQIANSLPLPATLADTAVFLSTQGLTNVTQIQLPFFFASPTQLNVHCDFIPLQLYSEVLLAVYSGDGGVAMGKVRIPPVAAPGGLFSANATGQGVAAGVALRVKANGQQIYEPIAQFSAAQNRFVSTPIDLGPEDDQVFLILFGTGVAHYLPTRIGSQEVNPTFVGPQGTLLGLDQINLPLPRALKGAGEVDIKMIDPPASTNTVRVQIK